MPTIQSDQEQERGYREQSNEGFLFRDGFLSIGVRQSNTPES
jgi:hypothetical protein